jgi:hypothetical protein
MLGSDYPFEMVETDSVGVTKAGVPEEHHEAVLGGAAARILCLNPVCDHHARAKLRLIEQN